MSATHARHNRKRAAVGALGLTVIVAVAFVVAHSDSDEAIPGTGASSIDPLWRESHGSGLRVRVPAVSAKPLALDFSDAWRVSHGNGIRFGIPVMSGKALPLDFSIAPAENR